MAPAAVPVKKTPDITDIIGEQKAESRNDADVSEKQKAEAPLITQAPLPPASDSSPLEPEPQSDFPTQWRTMFEQVFASVPTIYFTLKETLPNIENSIVKVTVKNEIQKEHFEAKIREVLEFLRNHYNEQIEDIIVETNEQMKTKKIIYDVKDKLQNFKKQNEEFEDFLQILDLKIKD